MSWFASTAPGNIEFNGSSISEWSKARSSFCRRPLVRALHARAERHPAGNRDTRSDMKNLIVFDLDGTLAESKSSLDEEMATLLGQLLMSPKSRSSPVVPGRNLKSSFWPIFRTMTGWRSCLCFRCAGPSFTVTTGAWKRLYSEEFTPAKRTASSRR
jgi:hypothetical protein